MAVEDVERVDNHDEEPRDAMLSVDVGGGGMRGEPRRRGSRQQRDISAVGRLVSRGESLIVVHIGEGRV